MDVAVGAYENISSADVGGFTESLVNAMPGLRDHRCSIGEPGGFIIRHRRGTYLPHIVEHVALELQGMIGHDVGYGRTRGGDEPGEYTIVFEYMHQGVGLRAAALALEIVQKAFASSLGAIDHAVNELSALAQSPNVPDIKQHVLCGITGGSNRSETREELARLGFAGSDPDDLIIDVAPAYILQAGLPYSRSDIAIVTNVDFTDVPARYAERERAERLAGVLIDALPRRGVLVAPAKAWDLQDRARDDGNRVAVFAPDGPLSRKDKKVARTSAFVEDRRIVIEHLDSVLEGGWIHDRSPAEAQVAAALAAFTLNDMRAPAKAGAGN
jgi:cyanophycin synthetase